MTIRSLILAPLLLGVLGFGLATSACAGESVEATEPSAADVTAAASSLTVAFDGDGRLFVPQFGADAERYHDGVHAGAGGTFTIENRGHVSRGVTVHFDGPPMLDESHEIHTTRVLSLAASESARLQIPNSRGRYTFRCPTSDSDEGSCQGVALSDGSGDWSPSVGVVQH